jgi:hypothetical protein
MPTQIETLLTRNLFEVFGERDATKRRATIAAIWANDGLFIDPHGRFVGNGSVDGAVADLHRMAPNFVFTVLGSPQAFHGIGRLAWGFGIPGKPPEVTGEDVITVKNGRIAALYTFIDEPAGG